MNHNWYVTTSIPYVNGSPHLGHALEFVQADAIARHLRQRGRFVRTQSGTDDHAIKNVSAAAKNSTPIQEFVDANAARFEAAADALAVHFDVFLRTSKDAGHRAGVADLWEACRDAGDLYRDEYTGLYCEGCEQFYSEDELIDGFCPEHQVRALEVTESNWFFRLSRYRDQIATLIESGSVVVEPVERRNEVLGFLHGEVHDISVSRPGDRAAWWGIPVPRDPEQVIYVWFDALANYITGVGYGNDPRLLDQWWLGPIERVHVIGKGILRFHAVYWLAFLLSAGLPLPTRIYVHDYLTVKGKKIAKSGQQAADPLDLVERFESDALRWWLLREPARVGNTDFTVERLVDAYNRDLANGLGNLVSRTLTLSAKNPIQQRADLREEHGGDALRAAAKALPGEIDKALDRFDFRAATQHICSVSEVANRYIEAEAPWLLAKGAATGNADAAQSLGVTLATLISACRVAAEELRPFLPEGSQRLLRHLHNPRAKPEPVFPRIEM